MLQEIIQKLHTALQKPLPGAKAHHKLAPAYRKEIIENQIKSNDYKLASVLILLHPKDDNISFPLMLRQQYKGAHSGQISLPGGKAEQNDNSLQATALRETEEEIGVPAKQINIIGQLSKLYIPPSNFLVHPFIGYIDFEPHFIPELKEVKQLYNTNLDDVLNPKSLQETNLTLANGKNITTPYFNLHQQVVWGATAMIISELKEILLNNKSI